MVVCVGALGHLQLANKNGPGRAEFLDCRAIDRGHEILVDAHPGSRFNTFRPAQVLERNGHAMQRAASFAGSDFKVRHLGVYQCAVAHYRDIAFEGPI